MGTKEAGEKLDEKGTAILYDSVALKNFSYFEEVECDLLSTVLINGVNSPYNLKYAGTPALFIEKYSTTTANVINYDPKNNTKTTADYQKEDIVMQVFFRDTVIAVQKIVEFPTVTTIEGENTVTKEALSSIEKQDLIDDLKAENTYGYESHFLLTCLTPQFHTEDELQNGHFADETIYIAKNDPAGWYTGYIPFGDNPAFGHLFSLTESKISELPGLELDKVTFTYYQFENGQKIKKDPVVYGGTGNTQYPSVEINSKGKPIATDKNGNEVDVLCTNIEINNVHRLAEIEVVNSYREKEATINYVAVGPGTIDLQDTTVNPTDKDFETILYYSGNPVGAVAKADADCRFAGWYLDAECKIPVTENHGYVDDTTFKPNKAKTITDDNLEVTYYAKFSSNTGSLLIVKEGALPNQSFVYKITSKDPTDVMYVTLFTGSNGTGSVEVVDAEIGKEYTVTQLTNWSWGYTDKKKDNPKTYEHKETAMLGSTTVFRFTGGPSVDFNSALSGTSDIRKNIYGGGS